MEHYFLDKLTRASCATAIVASLRGVRGPGVVQPEHVPSWLPSSHLSDSKFRSACPFERAAGGSALAYLLAFPVTHSVLGKEHRGSKLTT